MFASSPTPGLWYWAVRDDRAPDGVRVLTSGPVEYGVLRFRASPPEPNRFGDIGVDNLRTLRLRVVAGTPTDAVVFLDEEGRHLFTYWVQQVLAPGDVLSIPAHDSETDSAGPASSLRPTVRESRSLVDVLPHEVLTEEQARARVGEVVLVPAELVGINKSGKDAGFVVRPVHPRNQGFQGYAVVPEVLDL